MEPRDRVAEYYKRSLKRAQETAIKAVQKRSEMRKELVRVRRSNASFLRFNEHYKRVNHNLRKRCEHMHRIIRNQKRMSQVYISLTEHNDLKYLYEKAQGDLAKYRQWFQDHEYLNKK